MSPARTFRESLLRAASRFRILISAAGILAVFILAAPTWTSLTLGAVLIAAGEGVRVWSSGHIEKNDRVTREGPYSLSRNPLYVGNFIIGLGLTAAAGRPLLMALLCLLFPVLYSLTIRYEEEFLLRKFGQEFSNYVRDVPRFLSFSAFASFRPGEFRWGRVFLHREHNTWIAIACAGALFLAIWWFRGTP